MKYLIIVLCLFVNFTAISQTVEVLQNGDLQTIEKVVDFTVSRKIITLTTDQRKIELNILKEESKSVYITKDKYGIIYIVKSTDDERGLLVTFTPEFRYLLEYRLHL